MVNNPISSGQIKSSAVLIVLPTSNTIFFTSNPAPSRASHSYGHLPIISGYNWWFLCVRKHLMFMGLVQYLYHLIPGISGHNAIGQAKSWSLRLRPMRCWQSHSPASSAGSTRWVHVTKNSAPTCWIIQDGAPVRLLSWFKIPITMVYGR